MIQQTPPDLLLQLFHTAVATATGADAMPLYLPPPPAGRTLVVGAGKAAAAMAAQLEMAAKAQWPHAAWEKLGGLVVTRYGHGRETDRIRVVEAAHPVPDAAGRDAAATILAEASALGADDLMICLISGGGSALLALPAEGIGLEDKQAIARALLRSGASIHEINIVRRHLSAIKGGRLALAAHPARCVTLAISDVPGDEPATIASGPTVADTSTLADARAVLDRYGIDAPARIHRHLADAGAETPKPGDPRLATSSFHLLARPAEALAAAARAAAALELAVTDLGDRLEGEARHLAAAHADLAKASLPGTLILSGGETSVTVRGKGRGGRNLEYLLALGLALEGRDSVWALACDTDGIDGTEDAAGALLTPDSLERARAAGLDPAAMLADNDAYSLFQALGDLVVTGPTRTNVNDFRAILVL